MSDKHVEDLLNALRATMEALAMCEPRTRHGAESAAKAMLAARAALASIKRGRELERGDEELF